MSYIGIPPQANFSSGLLDRFTSTTGTTVTLTHDIASENDIVEVHYLNIVGQTNAPSSGSVGSSQLTSGAVTGAKLNTDVISAQTELATAPASTDELLVSDAGVLKRVDVSLVGGNNTPAFASTGASNSISANTYVKAQNGTELLDTDNCYDNSSNYRFTPNSAGKYFLTARIAADPDSNMQYMFAAIYKNGSKIAQSLKGFNNTDPIGNNYFSIELSMISEANGSSDYFEAYAYLHQNGDFRSNSGANLFSGYKLIGV